MIVARKIEMGFLRGALTDVLSHTVGVLAPLGKILDQVGQEGRHAIDGLGIIVKEDLRRLLIPRGRKSAVRGASLSHTPLCRV